MFQYSMTYMCILHTMQCQPYPSVCISVCVCVCVCGVCMCGWVVGVSQLVCIVLFTLGRSNIAN